MDNEAKKLFNAKAWAIDAPTNRAEFDDPNISPQIDPGNGWDSTFSEKDGNLPDRRHMNNVLLQTTSAAKESLMGVPLHDMDVNYKQFDFTNVEGALYFAKVATGPDTSNAVSPTATGQQVWEKYHGSLNLPSAPESFLGTTPEKATIIVQWKAGKDNGGKITSWKFQYRAEGDSWGTEETLQFPYKKLTQLVVGQKYQVQSAAINEVGQGEWGQSTMGAAGFIPIGTVPGGGDSINLRAIPGDTEVELRWSEPDNGGQSIDGYKIRWKEESNDWSNKNEQTIGTSREFNVTGLTNGVEYHFEVAAKNPSGFGTYSNQASATPISKTIPIEPPVLGAPILEAAITSITATANESPSASGRTASVSSYSWEYRQKGNSNWIQGIGTTRTIVINQSILPITQYEVRYTVTTIPPVNGHSPISTITTLEDISAVAPRYTQPNLSAPTITQSSSNFVLEHNVKDDLSVEGHSPAIKTKIEWAIKKSNGILVNDEEPWSNDSFSVSAGRGDSIEAKYRVKTQEVGWGSYSPSAFSDRKTGVPGKILNFYALSAFILGGKLEINYAIRNADDGGELIQSYKFYVYKQNESENDSPDPGRPFIYTLSGASPYERTLRNSISAIDSKYSYRVSQRFGFAPNVTYENTRYEPIIIDVNNDFKTGDEISLIVEATNKNGTGEKSERSNRVPVNILREYYGN